MYSSFNQGKAVVIESLKTKMYKQFTIQNNTFGIYCR